MENFGLCWFCSKMLCIRTTVKFIYIYGILYKVLLYDILWNTYIWYIIKCLYMLQPDCVISLFVKCLKILVISWNDRVGQSLHEMTKIPSHFRKCLKWRARHFTKWLLLIRPVIAASASTRKDIEIVFLMGRNGLYYKDIIKFSVKSRSGQTSNWLREPSFL